METPSRGVTGVSEGGGGGTDTAKLKLQIQDVLQTPNRFKTEKTSRHIVVKLLNNKDKRSVSRGSQKKKSKRLQKEQGN